MVSYLNSFLFPKISNRRCAFLALLILFWLLVPNNFRLQAEIFYPWKDIYIGALDAPAWAGLVLAPSPGNAFAFRLRVKRDEERADGIDLLFLVAEVGPHSPDGQYARVKFDLSLPFGKGRETPILKKPPKKSDTLTLEWSRRDERTVIGRIEAPKYTTVEIIHYFPWDLTGNYRHQSDGQVQGTSGEWSYLFWTHRQGDRFRGEKGEEVLAFPSQEDNMIYFVAGVGQDIRILTDHLYRYKRAKVIEKFLRDEKNNYDQKRVRVKGLYEDVDEAITNNIFWMVLYQAGHHRFYTPAGRRWIFPSPKAESDHWTIFEWDSFFNSLELSVESVRLAKDVLKAVLQTQYPNGNIPNWRGRFSGAADRSQPPVGAYVTLKLFQKTGDSEIIQFAYPYLKKWHAFWKALRNGRPRRDGNQDGLLEWGSDEELIPSFVPSWEKGVSGKQRAMWESGQDDLPNWDEAGYNDQTGTMTMNCLDLNSLYALDAWCLAQIAKTLGLRREYSAYLREYEEMKRLINEKLWDDLENFYFDRHWDGRFSRRKAASNFYPLIAGIPDQDRAMKMIRHLRNPDEYWGDFVVPTISRDDPAFSDQQYWRGTIWPPTNYLVYQGLKAYRFDVVASEMAKRSVDLFLRTWKNYQLCPENYDSRTGEAGGQRYQSWGPLFALIGLEEYIDFTPWEGFRFGILRPEKRGRLQRVAIQGRHYEVRVGKKGLELKEEGQKIIETNRPAVFRHFLYSENEISFEIKSLDDLEVKVRFLVEGKYQLRVDGQVTKVFDGDSLKFEVSKGEHEVLIWLLQKKEE